MRFVLKHLFAAGVVIVGSAAGAAALYFASLLWAVATNRGLGGPLALPAMVLAALVASAPSVVLLLLPATALAEGLRRRLAIGTRFAEIPISSSLLLAWLAALLAFAAAEQGWAVAPTIRAGTVLAGIHLVLLGVYWWAVQCAQVTGVVVGTSWRLTRSAAAGVSAAG